jgi:hypothetical protein
MKNRKINNNSIKQLNKSIILDDYHYGMNTDKEINMRKTSNLNEIAKIMAKQVNNKLQLELDI